MKKHTISAPRQKYHLDAALMQSIPLGMIITANPIITEVFKNYISNAIKYASDGKKILIKAIKEPESVLIAVDQRQGFFTANDIYNSRFN